MERTSKSARSPFVVALSRDRSGVVAHRGDRIKCEVAVGSVQLADSLEQGVDEIERSQATGREALEDVVGTEVGERGARGVRIVHGPTLRDEICVARCAVMSDRSVTTLDTKLGVLTAETMAILHAPSGFAWTPPSGVRVTRVARGKVDVILAFFTRRAALEREVVALSEAIAPAGALWIAWPKRTSKMATDLTDHVVRELALPLGLVDNKVCALDDTWTALRVVWRRDRREGT